MILNQLGIFGWKEEDENLVLASLLTGDGLSSGASCSNLKVSLTWIDRGC